MSDRADFLDESLHQPPEVSPRDLSTNSILVLGMHRSGTSALTGALALCGVWVGEEAELTEANAENPKGFWERRDLRALCDRLLRAAGADWWRPGVFASADFDPAAVPAEALETARADLAGIVAELDTHGLWAVKEPRLCLLLPLLRPVLGDPVCLHIHRDPLEVARSLAARNGLGVAEGLALWEVYTRAALAASAGLPRVSLLHGDLLADPAGALTDLRARLDALGRPGPAPPDAAALKDFVSPDLRRQRADPGEVEAFLSPAQSRLWTDLRAGRVPNEEIGADLAPAARQILRDLEARKTAGDALRAAQAGISRLEAARDADRAEAKARRAAHEAAAAAARREQVRLERAVTAAEAARGAEAARAAGLEAEAKALGKAKLQLDQTHRATAEALSLARRENKALRASTSWRVTAPLRGLADLMKGRRGPARAVRSGLAETARGARAVLGPALAPVLNPVNALLRRRERARDDRLIRNSGLFDRAWYLAEYPDVAKAGIDPLEHFLKRGWREGRNPSAGFDTLDYLKSYPAVARARENPLLDYLRDGRRRGRTPCAAASGQAAAARAVFDPAAAEAWAAGLRAHPAWARAKAAPPLVSVVVPSRDRIKLLPRAIDSVLAQSHARWELILVDDGSTDGTAAMVRASYSDPRIRVVGTPGLGVSGARNAGLAAAIGDLVAYLDSDNAWMPDYLELMAAEFERSGAASVYAVLKVREEKIRTGSVEIWYRAVPFDYARLEFANYIDLNIFMHRREMFTKFGGFDTELRRAVDWDLILRYVRHDPVSFANFVGAEYDHSDRADRLTVRELYAFKNIVRNKHWVDWEAETRRLAARDPDLVSVVVCVRGPMAADEEPLRSLYAHEAGQPFELVLVDNGGDAVTKALLADWQARVPGARLVDARDKVHFVLAANLGFAASSGGILVFLDEDVRVSPEWLRPLVRALKDPRVLGAQPKALNLDGTIHSVGLVFSDRSPIPYPLFAGLPGAFPASNRPRAVAAVGASCAAFRADDFAKARGFYPLFPSEGADIDFCLRLGAGAPVFRSVSDAIVVQHPARLPIRDTRVETDRREFAALWRGRVAADDLAHYARDGLVPGPYLPDRPAWTEAGLARWRPETVTETGAEPADMAADPGPAAPPAAAIAPPDHAPGLGGRVIALRTGCPRPEMKDNWGDYHFAVALAAAFLRKGVAARIDFAAEPDHHARPDDIALVLRGRQHYDPRPGTLNLMWLISHPDRVSVEELRRFDHVFIASQVWTDRLEGSGVRCSALLQCTDSSRFHPGLYDPALRSPALFVANSRKVLRSVVREAVEQDLPIDIYGEMWEGLAPAEWVKAETIDNVDLPRYYASADVVLNDHWDSMRENGFVSNRVFDVLATGAPLVTDRIAGLPGEIAAACHFFGDGTRLTEAVAAARADWPDAPGPGAPSAAPPRALSPRARAIAETVCRHHSFDARADAILAVIAAGLGGRGRA